MRMEVTDAPREHDEAFVIAQTRAYNAQFAESDVRSLCVFARDDSDAIIGGLTGRTYWRYLDIAFLWVDGKYRGQGIASRLMGAAESEAASRGCKHVFLDTLSFQALGFYQKLGYVEFGRLSGFSGKHERYWLHKSLGLADWRDHDSITDDPLLCAVSRRFGRRPPRSRRRERW